MEPDSTTYEDNQKSISNISLPFPVCHGSSELYNSFIEFSGNGSVEGQLVEKLQNYGLLVRNLKCSSGKPECKTKCKPARVIDRVQWVCEVCGARQPVRYGSFFIKLQCSLQQSLQLILAWCEDADFEAVADYIGVKERVANNVYSRLDDLAVKEQKLCKLGGENSVVLVEMYPDCMNQLSPDTTDQPHVHKVLMLADTKHIPTLYQLHVVKDFPKKTCNNPTLYSQALKKELEEVIGNFTYPESTIVTGNNVPSLDTACSLQHLVQNCDPDMQHFLTTRIWRQAVTLCSASRDFCRNATNNACGVHVQRYLNTSLYRLRYGDGFYDHVLKTIADQFTEKYDVDEQVKEEETVPPS